MKKDKIPQRIMKEIEKETNDEFRNFLITSKLVKHCKKCKDTIRPEEKDLDNKYDEKWNDIGKTKECDFCGKKGNWKNILRSTEISKKDGSDIILCNECLNNYASGDYDKIKIEGGLKCK